MKERFKFRCWKCKDDFELTTEIVPRQVLSLTHPFCGMNAVFDPAPCTSPVADAYRSDTGEEHVDLVLPDVLPTTPPE